MVGTIRLMLVYHALRSLSRKEGYAIVGPVGLYLHTKDIASREPFFSRMGFVDVVAPSWAKSDSVAVNKVGLSGLESAALESAVSLEAHGENVRVAAPEYVVTDYVLRDLPVPDLCEFVRCGGKFEPETTRALFKAVGRSDSFESIILPILYDFSK